MPVLGLTPIGSETGTYSFKQTKKEKESWPPTARQPPPRPVFSMAAAITRSRGEGRRVEEEDEKGPQGERGAGEPPPPLPPPPPGPLQRRSSLPPPPPLDLEGDDQEREWVGEWRRGRGGGGAPGGRGGLFRLLHQAQPPRPYGVPSPNLRTYGASTPPEREREGGGEGEDGVKGEGERHKGRSRGCDAMRVDKYERSRNSVVLVSAHFSTCASFLFNRDLYYNIGVNSIKKRSL